MTEYQTPQSSNVVRVVINDDETVLVEFRSGTYLYTGVDDQTKFALDAALEAGASAGKIVNALLKDEFTYHRIN